MTNNQNNTPQNPPHQNGYSNYPPQGHQPYQNGYSNYPPQGHQPYQQGYSNYPPQGPNPNYPYPTKPTKKSKKPLIITLSCILATLLITSSFITWHLLTQTTPKNQIAAGLRHTCAITKNGTYCWGSNEYGQLGNGEGGHDDDKSLTPVKVELPQPATQISAGLWHTCAITKTGTYCWGQNRDGQLGNGAGGHDDDKSLIPVKVKLPQPATQITTGKNHTCAITRDGIYCWGGNRYVQLGNGEGGGKDDRSLTPVKVKLAEPATQIVAGGVHTCTITKNGTYCWGYNSSGQLGNGEGGHKVDGSLTPEKVKLPQPATQITAGFLHTCAITKTGTYCWGRNSGGQLGNGQGGHQDDKSLTPVKVKLAEPATQISAGGLHTCATTKTSTYCWGNNDRGQIGNGEGGYEDAHSLRPVKVKLAQSATQIIAGETHTCATTKNNTYCWGDNEYGQLGNGQGGDQEDYRLRPVKVKLPN